MKKKLMIAFIFWSLAMMTHAKNFTVGYFPTTLPRDPIDIDIYLEHVAIGQVIETLIQVNSEGNIAPNLAKSWIISEQGKKFNFQLHSDVTFSNGKNLDCEDVAFSIARHITGDSQSKNYLSNIEQMNCKGKYELEIILKNPQVSFLKILSRDHLGILPKGWTFNKTAEEPWTGTGAYRFIQKQEGSFFVKNERYRNKDSVRINKWEVLKSDDTIHEAAKLAAPDLILHMAAHIKKEIEALPGINQLSFTHPLHFLQTSIWWYPLGKNYQNKELNKNIFSIMNEFVLELNKENKLELATGVVPKGIQGHITNRIPFHSTPIPFKKPKIIKVSVYASDYAPFFGNNKYKSFEQKYNFKFEISKVTPTENQPEEIKPDILIANYAGGFMDPDGFLIVLGSILGVNPHEYLKDKLTLYQEASKEQDWTKRGDMFRKINEYLVLNHNVVPAWKKDIYTGKSSLLIDDPTLFNYSVRLSRFKPK